MFGKILRIIFPLNISYKIRVIINKIFTSYVSSDFKKLGKGCTIDCTVYLLGAKNIEIGDNVTICKNVDLTAWTSQNGESFLPFIRIGNNVSIGKNAHITAINEILIDDNVLLGKFVTITDNSHGDTEFSSLNLAPVKRSLKSSGKVKIGRNVWIGDKVTILPDVTIGENTVIGANSVVVKDIPANCVAVGIPAKVIKNHK